MTIRLVGAELFHTDKTDMTKLIVAFHSFANALKYEYFSDRKGTVSVLILGTWR